MSSLSNQILKFVFKNCLITSFKIIKLQRSHHTLDSQLAERCSIYRFLPKEALAVPLAPPFLALPFACSSALRFAPEAVTDVDVVDTVKKL